MDVNRNIATALKVFVAGIAFVLVWAILRGEAWSAEFELNKPQVEQGVYCFTLKAATEVADKPNSEVVLLENMVKGDCIIAQAMVVYSKKVYRNGKVNVYEGKIGTTTIFNPSLFTAKGERDI